MLFKILSFILYLLQSLDESTCLVYIKANTIPDKKMQTRFCSLIVQYRTYDVSEAFELNQKHAILMTQRACYPKWQLAALTVFKDAEFILNSWLQ